MEQMVAACCQKQHLLMLYSQPMSSVILVCLQLQQPSNTVALSASHLQHILQLFHSIDGRPLLQSFSQQQSSAQQQVEAPVDIASSHHPTVQPGLRKLEPSCCSTLTGMMHMQHL